MLVYKDRIIIVYKHQIVVCNKKDNKQVSFIKIVNYNKKIVNKNKKIVNYNKKIVNYNKLFKILINNYNLIKIN
jgi:hypothetical protein